MFERSILLLYIAAFVSSEAAASTNNIYSKLMKQMNVFRSSSSKEHWDETVDRMKYLIAPGLLSNNKHCREDSLASWNELQKGQDAQEWAATMFESSPNLLPTGLPLLETAGLGHYKQCTTINAKINTSNTYIRGRNCEMYIKYDPLQGSYRDLQGIVHLFGKNDSKELSELENYIFKADTSITTGICVPDSCSYNDVKKGYLEVLNRMGFDILYGDCAKREDEREYSIGFLTVIIVLTVWATLIVGATVSDIVLRLEHKQENQEDVLKKKKKEKREPVMNYEEDRCSKYIGCFSLISNMERLLKIKPTTELDFFNPVRFICRNWVAWGHNNTRVVGPLAVKKTGIYRNYPYWVNQLWLNSPLGVDVFLYTSGFFATVSFFSSMREKTNCKSIVSTTLKNYFHRYIRLTPVYAWVILLFTNIYSYIGSGPVWGIATNRHFEECNNKWLYNLLYINDVEQSGGCLDDTWFMSTDMHLFVLTPLILIPLLYNKIIGSMWILCVYLFVTGQVLLDQYCTEIPFIGGNAFCKQYSSYMPLTVTIITAQAVPFIAGLVCGCMYVFKPKRRLHQPILGLVWISALVLLWLLLFLGIQPHRIRYGDVIPEFTFQVILHDHGFSLFMIWFGFACSQGYADWIMPFLTWSPFQVVGKLTYCAYLLSFPVRLWTFASRKEAIVYDNTAMLTILMGQWFFIYWFALVLYLCFECPSAGLIRIIQDSLSKPRPKLKTG